MKKNLPFFALFLLYSHTLFGQIEWVGLNGPLGANRMRILGTDKKGNIFLRREGQLFRSSDDGDNWVTCEQGLLPNQIAAIEGQFIMPSSGEIVVRIGPGNEYNYYAYNESEDRWVHNSMLSGIGIIVVDAKNNFWKYAFGDVYYSEDEGRTFNKIGHFTNSIQKFAAYSSDHAMVVSRWGSNGDFYYIRSDGSYTHKTKIDDNWPTYITFNPYSGVAFLSGTQANLRSADGGKTWEPMLFQRTVGDTAHEEIKDIFFVSVSKGWALCWSGIYNSIDGGKTWARLPGLDNSSYTDSYFWVSKRNYLFVNQTYTNDFLRSKDGGMTWESLSHLFQYVTPSNSVYANHNLLYVGTYNRFQRSLDGGETWSQVATPPALNGSTTPRCLVAPSESDLLALSQDYQILMSTDSGGSWRHIARPPTTDNPLFMILPTLNGTLYAFYNTPTSYKSTDKGQSWQPIRFNPYLIGSANSALHAPNGDIYMMDSGILCHYIAALDTTVYETTNMPVGAITGVVTASNKLLVVSSSNNKVDVLLYKGDARFETISRVPESYVTDMVATPNGPIFALSKTNLYQSDDDGLSWYWVAKVPSKVERTSYPSFLEVGLDQHLYLHMTFDVVYRSKQPIVARKSMIGTVWVDENKDCLRQPEEALLPGCNVVADGGGGYSAYSGSQGSFNLWAPPGNYQLSVRPPNPLFEACPPVEAKFSGLEDAKADVGLRPVAYCALLVAEASTPLLRRCFPNTYYVYYANEGTATASDVYVEVTLDSMFTYLSASILPSDKQGATLTFPIGDLPPGSSGHFWVRVEVSCRSALGQIHCVKTRILPQPTCPLSISWKSSFSEECRANIGAFDPNDKRAFVGGKEVEETIAPDGDEIAYLIRFQNTGTDTAFNVVVQDRLSELLDINAISIIATSHPYSLELMPGRVLNFVFKNIMLPDSNINEAASHGFIKFSVKVLPGIKLGSTIRNKAAIYFDFNDPVLTNTSQLVVQQTTHAQMAVDKQLKVHLNPNPSSSGQVRVGISGAQPDEKYFLFLTDMLGHTVLRTHWLGNTQTLMIENLPKGTYQAVLQDEYGRLIKTVRLVVL